MERHTRKDERGMWRLPVSEPDFTAFLRGTEVRVLTTIIVAALLALAVHLLNIYPVWLAGLYITQRLLDISLRLMYYDGAFLNLYFFGTTIILLAAAFGFIFVLFLEYLRTYGLPLLVRFITYTGFIYLFSLTFFAAVERPLYSFASSLRFSVSLLYTSSTYCAAIKNSRTRAFAYLSLIPSIQICLISLIFALIAEVLQITTKFFWIFMGYKCFSDQESNRSSNLHYISNKDAFVYQPIVRSNGIRLVILQRRSPFRKLNLKLYEANLDDNPDYEAISYYWGESRATQQILINGKVSLVPQATFDILHSRSSFWRTRHFWMDYICINQNDFYEKNQQVQLMTKIYKGAWRVLVCLEGPFLATYMAYSILQELLFYVREMKLSGAQIHLNCLPERYGIRWQCLDKFLGQAWFSRMWVIQEIAVAKRKDILCGGLYFDFDVLQELAKLITIEPSLATLFKSAPAGLRSMQSLLNIETMTGLGDCLKLLPEAQLMRRLHRILGDAFLNEEMLESIERLKLSNLLLCSGSFQASDERDKIFALFGLAEDYPSTDENRLAGQDDQNDSLIPSDRRLRIIQNIDLTPNYLKSTKDTYIDVARHFILTQDPFFIFSRAGIGHKRKLTQLPSWVPDWSIKFDSIPLQTPFLESDYNAGGSSEASINIYETKDIFECLVRSMAISQVKVLGKVFPYFDMQNEDDLDFLPLKGTCIFPKGVVAQHDWHEEVFSLASKYANPSLCLSQTVALTKEGNLALIEAVCRTIIGNKCISGPIPTKEVSRDYREWVSLLDYFKKSNSDAPPHSGGPHAFIFNKSSGPPRLTANEIGSKMRALDAWMLAVQTTAVGRRFCVFEDGYMGLVPENSEVGDVVHIFAGSKIPILLRPVYEEASSKMSTIFHVVGECYVAGIMDGDVPHGRGYRFDDIVLR